MTHGRMSMMDWFRKHTELVLLPVTLVVVVGLLAYYWVLPSWQAIGGIPAVEDQVRLRTELVKTLAQVILGGLVLGTLYFTWRRVRAAEQTVEVAQEGQITERFTRAVEQLGNQESTAVRLGGSTHWSALPETLKETTGKLWRC